MAEGAGRVPAWGRGRVVLMLGAAAPCDGSALVSTYSA